MDGSAQRPPPPLSPVGVSPVYGQVGVAVPAASRGAGRAVLRVLLDHAQVGVQAGADRRVKRDL